MTGEPGITAEGLEAFLKAADAHLEWAAAGDVPEGQQATDVMPLGEDTPAAYDAFVTARDKVDEYFARCRIAWLDPAVVTHTPEVTAEPAELADAAAIDTVLCAAPIAKVSADGAMPLGGEVNPLYRQAVDLFRELVVGPLVGAGDSLSETQWDEINAAFAAHEAWLESKRGAEVEKLGRQLLHEYLDDRYADAVRRLLAEDREVAERLAEVGKLKKLLLYQKHLLALANNFVSFPDLYDPDRRALFEMGSLVMDGRWFDLAVRVPDVQEHAELAKASSIFVMYLELTGDEGAEPVTVAVPAVAGAIGGLRVGKRGVFHRTDGRECDARVVRIIENPISFREALLAPVTRLGAFIAGKIESISGTAQKELEGKVGTAAQTVAGATHQPAVAATPAVGAAPVPSAGPSRGNLLLGASVSVAALSSAFAFAAKQLSALSGWQLLGAAVALVLLIFLPSAVMAGLKLRRRDLSAILEGCGWAINARMRLTYRQRRQFTCRRPYPREATGTPRPAWYAAVLWLVLAAAAVFGVVKLYGALGLPCGADEAPAAANEPAVPAK
jgi:hypothetical protein